MFCKKAGFMTRKHFIFILILILIDQLTKQIVMYKMFYGQVIPLTSFFQLTYITNTGIAFGMFKGVNIFLIVFTILVLAFFYFWFQKHIKESHISVAAFMLIFSGALGNLIDRIFYGHVIDFLELHLNRHYWPAFNVADSCITIGGVILFLSVFKKQKMQDTNSN
jgi:signal peptidase II